MTEPRGLSHLVARLTGRWHLQRLATVEEKIVKFGRAQREELAAQREAIDRLVASLPTRASAAAVHELQRRMEDLQRSFAHQDRAFAEAFERARLLDEQGTDDRRFARRIGELLRHDRPIVVGPWTGEVGFELLYWVPFVRWVVNTYGIAPERLLVVSRGGVRSWYGGLAARYADVFSYFSPEEFRVATEEAKKQRLVGKFDSVVLKRVLAAHGLDRADLLHPGMMYRLFMPFWREVAPMSRVEQYTAYGRIEGVTSRFSATCRTRRSSRRGPSCSTAGSPARPRAVGTSSARGSAFRTPVRSCCLLDRRASSPSRMPRRRSCAGGSRRSVRARMRACGTRIS